MGREQYPATYEMGDDLQDKVWCAQQKTINVHNTCARVSDSSTSHDLASPTYPTLSCSISTTRHKTKVMHSPIVFVTPV